MNEYLNYFKYSQKLCKLILKVWFLIAKTYQINIINANLFHLFINLLSYIANDDKSSESQQQLTSSPKPTTNLLMTAVKPPTTPQQLLFDLHQQQQQQLQNNGIDGDIEAGASSDGDSAEMKQRKKEIILAKQLERRQQQEAIRIKREEERARKAEELRQKEEEAAMKKLIEKTRKETIFQAYIDKKKQLHDESPTNYFGHPNSSLLSAKSKFHSTQRLKSSNTSSKQQQQQQAASNFAFDLKQNLIDQFDQASIISDRSTSTTQQMKSKSYLSLTCNSHIYIDIPYCVFVLLILTQTRTLS